jgi:ADP-ribosylglycohydrolase
MRKKGKGDIGSYRMDKEFKDRAMGCILGALIGDASGASLEFMKTVTEEELDNAMLMNGGGPLNIGPGQITDDSELAMCLLLGLAEAKGKFNPDLICKYYGMWMNSPPFSKSLKTNKTKN